MPNLPGLIFIAAAAGALGGSVKVSMRFGLTSASRRWPQRILAIALGVGSAGLMVLGLIFLANPEPPNYFIAGAAGAWSFAMSLFAVAMFSFGAARQDREKSGAARS